MAIREPQDIAEPRPELLLANWQNELDSANLYNYLARLEEDEGRSAILREMAESEVMHAGVMAAMSVPPRSLRQSRLPMSLSTAYPPGGCDSLSHVCHFYLA